MSIFPSSRLVRLLLLALIPGENVFSESPQASPVLWQSKLAVRDMAVLDDNRFLVATDKKLLVVDGNYRVREAAFPRLDRFFPGSEGGTLAAGITWKDENAAHLFTGETDKQTVPVIFPMKPRGDVYRAQDGSLWLANPKGLMIRHHNGKTRQWEAGRFTAEGTSFGDNGFRFEFAESPKGQVVLYQQGSKLGYGGDLKGFFIWDLNDLRYVRIEEKNNVTTGCAEFLSEKTVLLGTSRGLRVCDVLTGETIETWSPPENFLSEWARPVFTTLLPDGSRLVLYGRGLGHGSHAGTFEHGGYTQIVEIKNGEWKKIPLKMDYAFWDFSRSPRPVLVDTDGGVWTPNRGNGLAHRAPDGTWRSYDATSGVPFDEIIGLVMDGSRLWCADAKGTLAALDTRRLETRRPAKNPWMKLQLAAEPVWDREGRAFFLSSENGGQVTVVSKTGENKVIALSDSGYNSLHTQYMAVDTDGDPWLFGSDRQRYAVAFHKGGVWLTFPRDIRREGNYPPNAEQAFQSMLGKDPAFRVGMPDDPFYPVFSDDGRIVFTDRLGKVRYFDGLMWLTPAWPPEAKPTRNTGPLFFHEGRLVAIRDGVSYHLDEENWTNRKDEKQPAPWIAREDDLRPLQPARVSASDGENRPKRAPVPPPGCPIEPSGIAWTHQNGYWRWVGNAKRIAGSPGGAWLTMDIAETPLSAAPAIEKMLYTPDNRIFFKHSVPGYLYSVYTPPALEAGLENPQVAAIHKRNQTLELNVSLNRDRDAVLQQYRIDQGPWSGLMPVGPIHPGSFDTPGEHTLTVLYHGKNDLAASGPLQVRFTNAFDARQEILNAIEMLGSDTFAERNEAIRLLEEIGEPALNPLMQMMDSPDPEIRHNARELVAKIRKKTGKKD